MAIEYKQSPTQHKPYVPNAYTLEIVREGKEPIPPSPLQGRTLMTMLMVRARYLSRDIRNAIQDGGLNEDGYAVNIPLWAECIEDITRAYDFLIYPESGKAITFPVQYAGRDAAMWTVSRMEESAA